ncbi:hypothetical protein [Bythopirellula goksoeyrii]|uniref:Uncharacterized protein n=1 Tax=Bythopirellula goksoeyrii TaxID=1400387 RepID=A0A5B9Q715_9BACT|nr:hypothetical protein [Bythopirellula goksoeyrii]QEG33509.1 hypothetical protein Pr1d_07730 [Bythopirellula goksoeyrii]
MNKNVISGVLAVLVLAAVAIPHNLPTEIKDPYESKLLGWLISLWISWGVALLVLIIGCKFGPKLNYDESATLGEIIHWKHFPKNWREMLFVLLFFAGVVLVFILTIAYISAYGEQGH